jgi:hypothetical protein
LLVYGEKIKKMERSMWNTRFLPRKNKTWIWRQFHCHFIYLFFFHLKDIYQNSKQHIFFLFPFFIPKTAERRFDIFSILSATKQYTKLTYFFTLFSPFFFPILFSPCIQKIKSSDLIWD